MSGTFLDLRGTSFPEFQIGLLGPLLKAASGDIEARTADDSGYAALAAELFKTYGDDFELNAGATEAGDDWKLTLRRPSTGMSHNLIVVFPSADPAPGQLLGVASLAGDILTLQWISSGSGADKVGMEVTAIAFGDSSPVAMFSLPATAVIDKIKVIVDEPFDGAPQLSIGISGQTSKYMAANQIDLTDAAATAFQVSPNLPAAGIIEALIATYSAGGATEGSGRILVYYGEPA